MKHISWPSTEPLLLNLSLKLEVAVLIVYCHLLLKLGHTAGQPLNLYLYILNDINATNWRGFISLLTWKHLRMTSQ